MHNFIFSHNMISSLRKHLSKDLRALTLPFLINNILLLTAVAVLGSLECKIHGGKNLKMDKHYNYFLEKNVLRLLIYPNLE